MTAVNAAGIRSLGKAAYFFTLLPYVSLTALLAYGATLPGAADGVEYYLLSPDWSALADPDIWLQACVQIIMSLSVAIGSQERKRVSLFF